MLNLAEHELVFFFFFFYSGLDHLRFILLINVKMPTIVGILTFMSRMNFSLTLVEHE